MAYLVLFGGSAAQISIAHFGVVCKLAGLAAHGNGARLQHIGTVGNFQRHLGVLFHQKDGDAVPVHIADDVENLLHQKRRKAHRGFIHQQHARAGHQRAANGQHLLFPAGKRARQLLAPLFQTRQKFKHHLVIGGNCLAGICAGIGAKLQVLLHGKLGKHAPPLRHLRKAKANDFMRFRMCDGGAAEGNFPCFGL